MNNPEDLEKDFYTLEQLRKIIVEDNGEKLVDIKDADSSIRIEPQKANIPYTGNTIYVRETVAAKLTYIQQFLADKELSLKITDGYRPMEVQERYWEWRLAKDKQEHSELEGETLENFSIKFTAKPEFAYHTTGGAVDLTIVYLKGGKELDMGTSIDHFSKESYSHYSKLPAQTLENRKLLSSLMAEHEFYNFPSEWWHFSYGTLDWALYYKMTHAIYGPIRLDR